MCSTPVTRSRAARWSSVSSVVRSRQIVRSEAVKRGIDIVGSLLGLVVSAPVVAVEPMLVRLARALPCSSDSPGPALITGSSRWSGEGGSA